MRESMSVRSRRRHVTPHEPTKRQCLPGFLPMPAAAFRTATSSCIEVVDDCDISDPVHGCLGRELHPEHRRAIESSAVIRSLLAADPAQSSTGAITTMQHDAAWSTFLVPAVKLNPAITTRYSSFQYEELDYASEDDDAAVDQFWALSLEPPRERLGDASLDLFEDETCLFET